jgi:hypothetical protein
MLHLLMAKGPWFRASSYGYGSGLPFKWQGWLLMGAHVALLCGVGLAFQDRPLVMMALLLAAAFAPIRIYAARTEGGWRWRWGNADEKRAKPRR